MTVSDRIALALSLGDHDVALLVSMTGLDRQEALRRIRARRADGRTLSKAASVLERR